MSDPLEFPDGAPSANATVSRLKMITINATVGIGLYGSAGTILLVGGPLALVLSFFAAGLVAWAVMQCVAELLCLWPMPGALALYVKEFLDPELAIVVGIAYWCV